MTSRPVRTSRAGFGQFPDSVFAQQTGPEELHPSMVRQARQSGQLNLSNRGLAGVPERVWSLGEPDKEEQQQLATQTMDSSGGQQWWDCVDLTKLILACNNIQTISPKVGGLVSLQVLDLHDNQLSELPAQLGELTQLSRLNLSHNRLQSLPEPVFLLAELRLLQVNNNSIGEVGELLGNLNMLGTLDLAHNQLTSLPSSCGFLTRLTSLNLSHNQLDRLPPELGSLAALATLDLSSNRLAELPADMANLSHLEILYCRHNRLTTLPTLTNCSNLKELHLGNNRVTGGLTAEQLQHIAAVRTLDLRENKITSLPDEITCLASLERLDVTNNDLAGLPFSLGVLPHLKAVQLDGNPMKTIRRDIMARGTVGLLKYLRSRLEEGQVAELQKRGTGNVSPVPQLVASHAVPDKFTMKTSQATQLNRCRAKNEIIQTIGIDIKVMFSRA